MTFLFSILALIAMGVITWLDWENPDKKDIAFGPFDSNTTNLNNDRRANQIARLEKKIKKLNDENPGRLFYRSGPRIKEYTPEEVNDIYFINERCKQLNKPYPLHQKHYYIKNGEIKFVGEERVKKYKFEAKVIEINQDPNNGIICSYDRQNNKIINSITKEEIEFNFEDYDLAKNKSKVE